MSGTENPEDGATEKVWTPVEVAVTIKISIPFPEDEASVWDATELPLSDVIVPPEPPASTPQ